MEPDFTGFATKNGLKCADGRTIVAHAFKGNDGQTVPLVWMHQHNDQHNVLGHVLLENTEDGVRAKGFFNTTPEGQRAKELVEHGDINALSIYANQLVQRGNDVLHGSIKEVSLVLAGANPGALIDTVGVGHADGAEGEAIIYTGLTIEHGTPAATPPAAPASVVPTVNPGTVPAKPALATLSHAAAPAAAPTGQTVEEIFNTLTDVQKNVVFAMIGQALEQSGITDPNNQEGTQVRNVFDQTGQAVPAARTVLSHDDMKAVFADAVRTGSLRTAVSNYAISHGITDIDTLFPDAKAIANTPEMISRQVDWVAGVLSGTKHLPFAKIKSLYADITMEEARAKGYIKGNMKKEEFFSVSKRETGPKTVYKKQKLDRDDILDITDFDVVVWIKAEMRLMLDEEIARAILIGDGREVDDEDKIDETAIRPIATDDDMFTTKVYVNVTDSGSSADEIVDAVVSAMQYFKGTGTPTWYTTRPVLTTLMLVKDTLGRRIYPTLADLTATLGVDRIVPVEAMQTQADLLGVIVNLQDYSVGTNAGGDVTTFDDFDIDYNQYKWLIETRLSGAMTKYKGAIAIRSVTGTLVAPTTPTFVSSTGVVTIPSTTGVVYKNGSGTTLSSGAQTALSAGASVTVVASPASGYFFATSENDTWVFTRPAS